MTVEQLLSAIRKTNPEMTMEKMLDELEKCRYSAASLMLVEMNCKK